MRRFTSVTVGGAVALLAVALVLVLTLRHSSSAPPPVKRGEPAPSRARSHPTVKPKRHASAQQRKATRKQPDVRRPARRAAPPQPLPRTTARWKPWRHDGWSFVAGAKKRWLAVYSRPHVGRPALLLRSPDRIGSPRYFLVHSRKQKWVRVYLPTRPNMQTGWVRRRSVRVLKNPYRIVVRLRAHQLELWKGKQSVLRAKTVVGKSSTPTPAGMFFIVDLLRPPDPGGAYGPYAFNLSAHSRIFFHFAGGDGVVAIHGTNEPSLLGQSVSHGCIRVRNDVIRRLARVLPLGTPVLVRA